MSIKISPMMMLHNRSKSTLIQMTCANSFSNNIRGVSNPKQYHEDHHIQLHYFDPQVENRHLNKNIFTKKQMIDVNWLSIERAFRKKSIADKLPIFNLLHGKWLINLVIVKWDPDKNPIYNRCTAVEETFHHVYCC